jgi:hypothetical protein
VSESDVDGAYAISASHTFKFKFCVMQLELEVTVMRAAAGHFQPCYHRDWHRPSGEA